MSQVNPRGRAPSPFFRHRPLGRAPSPPTWACYEQISSGYDNGDSASDDSDDDDEDEDDEAVSYTSEHVPDDDDDDDDDGCSEDGDEYHADGHGNDAATVEHMDMDAAGDVEKKVQAQKDKGKQRAVEPAAVSESQQHRRRRRHRQHRQPVVTLRPILTIQRSQGFVWNQDLFVPPYIKDRYVASTSPPSSKGGFISTSASSTNPSLENYEIEVVEIRVSEGELDDIIP